MVGAKAAVEAASVPAVGKAGGLGDLKPSNPDSVPYIPLWLPFYAFLGRLVFRELRWQDKRVTEFPASNAANCNTIGIPPSLTTGRELPHGALRAIRQKARSGPAIDTQQEHPSRAADGKYSLGPAPGGLSL